MKGAGSSTKHGDASTRPEGARTASRASRATGGFQHDSAYGKPGYVSSYGVNRSGVRGNRIASVTLSSPATCFTSRSIPSP